MSEGSAGINIDTWTFVKLEYKLIGSTILSITICIIFLIFVMNGTIEFNGFIACILAVSSIASIMLPIFVVGAYQTRNERTSYKEYKASITA